MIRRFFSKSDYTLVIGHTHKHDEYHSKENTIKVYNVSGWIVEEGDRDVAPTMLEITKDGYRSISIDIPQSEFKRAAERANTIKP